MVEIPEKRILEVGREAHKAFVDFMYPRFNYGKHPGYSIVRVLPIIFAGGASFNPDEIFLNDVQTSEEGICDVTYHESAHLLHPYSRKLYYQVGRDEYKKTINGDLSELIANFGAIVFLSAHYDDERVGRYVNERDDGKNITNAFKLHEISDELLGRLSNMDQKKALKMIRRLLKP